MFQEGGKGQFTQGFSGHGTGRGFYRKAMGCNHEASQGEHCDEMFLKDPPLDKTIDSKGTRPGHII